MTPRSPAPVPPRAAAVVVAAGASTRMAGAPVRKPFLELAGVPILERSCAALAEARTVDEVVVVAHELDLETVERWRAERPALAKVRAVVAGGAERSDSVARGVARCSTGPGVICVHDAARPLVTAALVDAVVEAAAREGAAIPAVAVRDTLKRSRDGRHAESTVDRSELWCAQTPQAFHAEAFRELVERARRETFAPTDCAAMWERWRGPVALVAGDHANAKITSPDDLALAEAVLAARAAPAGGRH